MKKWFFTLTAIFILAVIFSFTLLLNLKKNPEKFISPLGKNSTKTTKGFLNKYSFDNLKKKVFAKNNIIIENRLKDNPDFASYLFFFTSDGKRVSGLANIPKKHGKLPIVLLIRGYINKETYKTGAGSRRIGEYFATKGFITLAPDFLGYGESDIQSENPMEERFQTYTAVLSLLSSFKNLNRAFLAKGIRNTNADIKKVGIWGHSNGGQIALSVLEITGGTYPTVLWAPVSKPFPYSLLYYADSMEDHGQLLQKIVADFEKEYKAEKFSPTNYLGWINSPIQLHQGGTDHLVPQSWSDELADKLEKLGIKVTYYTYPHEDHNFLSGNWPLVASRTISFYKTHLIPP